jgi:hypothetical protein
VVSIKNFTATPLAGFQVRIFATGFVEAGDRRHEMISLYVILHSLLSIIKSSNCIDIAKEESTVFLKSFDSNRRTFCALQP